MTEPNNQAAGFTKLLRWLNPDPQVAGGLYEEIRHSLIKIFAWKGCHDPEDLADETIVRVTRKIDQLVATYKGDPALYFHGVAKHVLFEYHRQRTDQLTPEVEMRAVAPPEMSDENEKRERDYECLEQCLGRLSASDRELILHYYQEGGQAKIEIRKKLAEEKGMRLNALRVKVHRIRTALYECIKDCMGKTVVK